MCGKHDVVHHILVNHVAKPRIVSTITISGSYFDQVEVLYTYIGSTVGKFTLPHGLHRLIYPHSLGERGSPYDVLVFKKEVALVLMNGCIFGTG